MKKKYTKTEMEIIEFDVEDVITTSGEGDQNNKYYTAEGGEEDTL